MRIKKGLKVRKIADEWVVIVQNSDISDMTKVINLNETLKFLWDSVLDKDFDEVTITDLLLEKYDVEKEIALRDARKWIESLKKCQVLDA
jgi:hypothetical protein